MSQPHFVNTPAHVIAFDVSESVRIALREQALYRYNVDYDTSRFTDTPQTQLESSSVGGRFLHTLTIDQLSDLRGRVSQDDVKAVDKALNIRCAKLLEWFAPAVSNAADASLVAEFEASVFERAAEDFNFAAYQTLSRARSVSSLGHLSHNPVFEALSRRDDAEAAFEDIPFPREQSTSPEGLRADLKEVDDSFAIGRAWDVVDERLFEILQEMITEARGTIVFRSAKRSVTELISIVDRESGVLRERLLVPPRLGKLPDDPEMATGAFKAAKAAAIEIAVSSLTEGLEQLRKSPPKVLSNAEKFLTHRFGTAYASIIKAEGELTNDKRDQMLETAVAKLDVIEAATADLEAMQRELFGFASAFPEHVELVGLTYLGADANRDAAALAIHHVAEGAQKSLQREATVAARSASTTEALVHESGL